MGVWESGPDHPHTPTLPYSHTLSRAVPRLARYSPGLCEQALPEAAQLPLHAGVQNGVADAEDRPAHDTGVHFLVQLNGLAGPPTQSGGDRLPFGLRERDRRRRLHRDDVPDLIREPAVLLGDVGEDPLAAL